MNKIATYLNQHMSGHVTSSKAIRQRYSYDSSIISQMPELVAFPRTAQDIRKIARFSWQFAEKGHPMGMTIRGLGASRNGSAVGRGLVLDTSTYLNAILDISFKERRIQVQPGARLADIETTLQWQGMTLPGARMLDQAEQTIGGVIASDTAGVAAKLSESIERIEVVLANGDILETGRLSAKEVNRKCGLQTLEGEIYRKISALWEDNEELLETLANEPIISSAGYQRIAQVRRSDGSYDLTPLFFGSQGTLGIITEVSLITDYYAESERHLIIPVDSMQTGRDIAERILELSPSELLVIDGALYRMGARFGKTYAPLPSVDEIGAVISVRFNDLRSRKVLKNSKKVIKMVRKMEMEIFDADDYEDADFSHITTVATDISRVLDDAKSILPLFDGISIPDIRREEFEIALRELEARHHIELPLLLNLVTNTYNAYPQLSINSVTDKQKLFKLMADIAIIARRCKGTAYASDGEGRVKSAAAWSAMSEEEQQLYQQVRDIFDPFKTLNPGVKQPNEVRHIVASLRSDYGQDSLL